MESRVERIWRVRKHHTWIDVQLRDDRELQFFYDGALVFERQWPTRDAALRFAAERLGELQRAGWNPHW